MMCTVAAADDDADDNEQARSRPQIPSVLSRHSTCKVFIIHHNDDGTHKDEEQAHSRPLIFSRYATTTEQERQEGKLWAGASASTRCNNVTLAKEVGKRARNDSCGDAQKYSFSAAGGERAHPRSSIDTSVVCYICLSPTPLCY